MNPSPTPTPRPRTPGRTSAAILGSAAAFLALQPGVAAAATPATATLSLVSNVQPIRLSVNGRTVNVNGGYEATQITVPLGTVQLAAQANVRLTPDVCYAFSNWSDGSTSPARSIKVGYNTVLEIFYQPAAADC